MSKSGHATTVRRPLPVGVTRVLIIIGLLVVWEIIVRVGLLNPILVSKPTSMVKAMGTIAVDPKILTAFKNTVTEFLIGFVLGGIAGIVIGLVLALIRSLREVLYTPLMILYATPKSIFIPIIVVFLGIGIQTPAFFAAGEMVFPLVVAIVAGVAATDKRLMTAARSLGASTPQMVRDVIIPSIVPPLISGIWLGIKQAILGVLLAELLVSGGSNVGYYLSFYASTFRPDEVYALIAWLSLFAMAIAFGWSQIEKRAQRWQIQTQ